MRLRRPSPAALIALLALFVALGGSSYAALNLPKNSIGAKQLKKNSVTSPKVKAGSLLLSDFRRSQRSRLRGPRGAQGAQGAQGLQGAKGDKGDKGDPGPTFGDTTSASSAAVTGCGPSSALTQTVTVTKPSRILASAGGAWARDATNLDTGTVAVALLQGGTVVGYSAQGFASDFAAGPQRITVSVTAVLYEGTNSFPATPTAYVAQPGTYQLRLDAGASDGTCTGTSTLWRPYLTYTLLGTSG